MVWHNESLQYVPVFVALSIMVVQDVDKTGSCVCLSGYNSLSVYVANLCELANSKVSRALFEVVYV